CGDRVEHVADLAFDVRREEVVEAREPAIPAVLPRPGEIDEWWCAAEVGLAVGGVARAPGEAVRGIVTERARVLAVGREARVVEQQLAEGDGVRRDAWICGQR